MQGDNDSDELSTVLRSSASPTDAAPVFTLAVVEGPDRGLAFRFDAAKPSRVLIGQSPACELRLSDRSVSRRHASIELARGAILLTDLQSTNGTTANGLPIVAAYLRGSEVVRVGATALRVDAVLDAAKIELAESMRFGRMIGASEEMRRLYPMCERIAASDVPVVIEGETGTGKEVLAEALHENGKRAAGPFVVFDCTAVPPTLLESTLFGHERGAFTGASTSKRGVFEEASGGTLLIDEIGELDVTLQPKLLRAIEKSEVQRVGSNRWTRVDVRVLAATRRDLDREVLAGRFRDDLFYRLAVARVELPPLRRRRGDVGVLARHFWRSLGGASTPMPPDLISRLEDYAWPGNVRELHNTIARALALGEIELAKTEATSGARAATDPIERAIASSLPLARARQMLVDEFEKRYVERVLERHGGNVARAAAASGIARRYFQLLRARHAK